MSATNTGTLRKRSVMIAGHATSVSMEPAFWRVLSYLAAESERSINQLVTEIDRGRTGNLSSAIRVWILEECLRRSTLEVPATGADGAVSG